MLMNKLVYLSLSILYLTETVANEFWYDYVKPIYGENSKRSYMDTNSFIVHVKIKDIFKDIAENCETRLGTSNVELDRPFPKREKKKVIRLMKNELSGQIMNEFVGLRAKTYSYLKDNNNKDKKAKDIQKCVIKRKTKFQDYKSYLEEAQIENKINHFKKNWLR